jgi:hypothetical protein
MGVFPRAQRILTPTSACERDPVRVILRPTLRTQQKKILTNAEREVQVELEHVTALNCKPVICASAMKRLALGS